MVTPPPSFACSGRDGAGASEPVTTTAVREYLSMRQVVERYAGVWSAWTLYEWTRTGRIPHRKLPGRRELIFPLDELQAFEDGAPLETLALPDGGRSCRPIKP
jgi:hypothetical protein